MRTYTGYAMSDLTLEMLARARTVPDILTCADCGAYIKDEDERSLAWQTARLCYACCRKLVSASFQSHPHLKLVSTDGS